MGALTISPRKYGSSLAKALPKAIENDRELEHFSEMLESLDRLGRELTPDDKALEVLLARRSPIAFPMRQKDQEILHDQTAAACSIKV